MKRILAAAVLLAIALVSFSSCAGKAPELEEIYGRVVELVENSHEINEIFFGSGLPTYPRDDELPDPEMSYIEKDGVKYLLFTDPNVGRLCRYYDSETKEFAYAKVIPTSELKGDEGHPLFVFEKEGLSMFATDYDPSGETGYVYDDAVDNKAYNVVKFDSPYLSIEQIKSAAAEVYSADYLEAVFGVAFDGIASFEASSSGVVPARFIEQGGLLRQYNKAESMLRGKRIYDYSTMKIVRPSNGRVVNITMDSHIEGEDEILNVRLSLVLQNGKWYLNTPTY